MPRPLVIPSDIHPFHITGRCLNRDWFKVPLASVWPAMEDQLFLAHAEFGLRIHAFVLMPNHFHLLASTPRANLSTIMAYFMGQTAREITRLAGRINQTYGARHHKSMIASHHYYMSAYKYLYRNPVRANLCRHAEEYTYSTLAGICGVMPLRIPIENDLILFNPKFDQSALSWINQPPLSETDDDLIRKALRRKIYQYTRDKNSKKMPEIETRIY